VLVVSDATPLNILCRLGHVWVLERIFGAVMVPPAVVDELTAPGAPEPVRERASSPPDWVHVVAPTPPFGDFALDPGETEALALAIELRATNILIDERRARRTASQLGLKVTGTVGILETAHRAGLIHLSSAIAALVKTDFHVSRSLLDDTLRRNNLPPLP
jgi:predicted nucleic acid-binding protein